MAPRPLLQSWPSPSPSKVGGHPRPHRSTLQWHPAMAPSNGTSWSSPSPHNDSTLQWHPTMARQWHRVLWPCNGTLVPRPIRQSGSSPPPLLEVRTPIAIAIWGKNMWLSQPGLNLTGAWFKSLWSLKRTLQPCCMFFSPMSPVQAAPFVLEHAWWHLSVGPQQTLARGDNATHHLWRRQERATSLRLFWHLTNCPSVWNSSCHWP